MQRVTHDAKRRYAMAVISHHTDGIYYYTLSDEVQYHSCYKTDTFMPHHIRIC